VNAPATREHLLAALAEIDDPEMPISLVDLGLIYGLQVRGRTVTVDLTFTAMGCPASEFIIGDIRERLLVEPAVDEVIVNVVWDPPWTTERVSPDGKLALEAWGLSV
jgi:metal-sulfur cluster biosynthetic enzyme